MTSVPRWVAMIWSCVSVVNQAEIIQNIADGLAGAVVLLLDFVQLQVVEQVAVPNEIQERAGNGFGLGVHDWDPWCWAAASAWAASHSASFWMTVVGSWDLVITSSREIRPFMCNSMR